MVPVRYNLRSLAVRKTTTAATALGIALVVFVLAAALMLSAGVKKTLAVTGSDDVAIVLRKGSDAEMGSGVEDPQVSLIKAMPGIAKDSNNEAIATGEVVVVQAMEKLGAPGMTNVLIRGLPEAGLAFRKNMKIVEGRAAKPGTDEVIVGKAIRGRFKDVDLEQSFDIKKNRPVKVVGVFEAGGSAYESEIWADLETIRTAFGREGAVSSVRVRLESPSKFEAFKKSVESDKRLGLMALTEPDYYAKQSADLAQFITILGTLVSVFFSIGAMIGAMITMYGAVSSRQREIGTLRALGFSRSAILFSFVLESFVLSLIGGAIGAAASIAMKAVKISMVNFASWSEIVFSFEPTPEVMGFALGFAGLMGLIGGFLPAIRAASVSPVVAMRGG